MATAAVAGGKEKKPPSDAAPEDEEAEDPAADADEDEALLKAEGRGAPLRTAVQAVKSCCLPAECTSRHTCAGGTERWGKRERERERERERG